MFFWHSPNPDSPIRLTKSVIGPSTEQVSTAPESSGAMLYSTSSIPCQCIFWCEARMQLPAIETSGGQSTQIKYLSKSTDTYNKILLQ